jgi:4-hydroxy-3-polyprenylbenzoate decarboxylase
MEEQSVERSGAVAGSNQATPVAWRDLREWVALAEANGLLKRIDQPVDADEELAAIAYLATRREDAPALMFDTITGDRSGASVLANMLGASKERYALAVGLDPTLSVSQMIAASRDIMQRRIACVGSSAPVTRWC